MPMRIISLFKKTAVYFFLIAILSSPCFSALQDIDWSKVADQKNAEACWTTLNKWENKVRRWHHEWPYKEPKKLAVKELVQSYNQLEKMSKKDSNNFDLELAKGINAHYLYNLDGDDFKLGKYSKLAEKAYSSAKNISPEDVRPDWFLGAHLVYSLRIKEGMDKLIPISQASYADQFPSTFWIDFGDCAYMARMPITTLRAFDLAEKKGTTDIDYINSMRTLINEIFFEVPSDTETYKYTDVWFSGEGKDPKFCNQLFGYCVEIPDTWKVSMYPVKNGFSVLDLTPPAYTDTNGGTVTASLLIAVERKPSGKKLMDAIKENSVPGSIIEETQIEFPYKPFKAANIFNKNMYKNLGGAHVVKLAFSRSEPAYPGLLFETPKTHEKAGDGVTIYSPNKSLVRFKGELLYTIILDIGESVYPQAKKDLDLLLSKFVVE